MTTFADAFAALEARAAGEAEVGEAFAAILRGEWNQVQIASYSAGLRLVGETTGALVGGARALRAAMVTVPHGLPRTLDTCGTGGDGKGTLNVSTAAAFVVAAAGIPVAKHGNRSVSSRAGSADVIEALGGPLALDPLAHATLLRETGFTFLFAPAHHPALKHAAEARRSLGVRTIFNALGPLANPAGVSHQLVGVYVDSLRPLVAEALLALGTEGAWVVRAADGTDEISPSSPTRVSVVAGGEVREIVISPEDFGFKRLPASVLDGGDASANADAIRSILARENHPARDAVLLNAAAAIAVVESLTDLAVAGRRAEEGLANAAPLLERWLVRAKELAG